MGCVASKPDINDRHADIFQVVNVDEVGHRFSPAKLQVTVTDLVLHQRGKAAIRWPLRCLRRYGFDAELFSFESGRRCITGPGIYAFKCRRAEALFNMLQLRIQNITEDAASRDLVPTMPNPGIHLPHEDTRTGVPEHEGYLEPLPQRPTHSHIPNNVVPPLGGNSVVVGGSGTMGVTSRAAYGGGICGMVGTMHSPASPPTPMGHPPPLLYEGYDGASGVEDPPPTPGHNTRDPPSTPLCTNHVDKHCPSWLLMQLNRRPRAHPLPYPPDQMYVNVLPERSHVYVNMLQKEVPAVPPRPPVGAGWAGSGSSHSGTTTTTDTAEHPTPINYIVVEMEQGSDSSAVPPTSPSGSGFPQQTRERYAQIDFDKTRALSYTAKQAPGREDGSRKTRHNSTFTSPAAHATLSHHNSSFSD